MIMLKIAVNSSIKIMLINIVTGIKFDLHKIIKNCFVHLMYTYFAMSLSCVQFFYHAPSMIKIVISDDVRFERKLLQNDCYNELRKKALLKHPSSCEDSGE